MRKKSQRKTSRKLDHQGETQPEVDARVLGQILAAQNVIFALPNATRIAEFYAQTLLSIPGITACRVCLANQSIQAGRLENTLCAECETLRRRNYPGAVVPADPNFTCRLSTQFDKRVIAIDSYQHHFGFFVFEINQHASFEVYQPFVLNLSNYVAITFENRLQENLLQKTHHELEQRVEERTHDLATANQDLQREIVERRRTEIALRESEEQVRQLFDESPLAMILSQGSTERVEWVNKKFTELFGYTIVDMPDVESWWPLAYPDETYREEVKTQWQTKLDRGSRNESQTAPIEATVRCKDGSYRYIEFRYSSIGEKHLVVFVDLTERKHAEAELIAREREYHVLVENIPDLVVRYDTSLRRIYVNQAWEKASGLSAGEVINVPAADVPRVPQPINTEYMKKLQFTLTTGVTQTAEFTWTNAHGKILSLEYIIVPEYSQNGNVSGVLSVGRDITERKRMEEALSASEAELRTLMSAMTDIIIVGNREGRYLKIVDTNSTLVFKPPEELLGRTLHEVFPKDQADFFLSHLHQALDTKQSVKFEYSLDIQGQDVWFDATVSPMTDDKTLMVARDITDRKKAEAQLLASEQLFRALVENSPDFIARYDRAFRRIYVNPAIQKLFGVTTENIVGRTPAERSPVYAPQVYIDHIQQVIDTAIENIVEMPYRTANGEMHWGHMRFVPEFGPDGQVVSVLAIGRDIHEIKENERRFRMLAENFPDLVMRFAHDGRYIYVNPAFEKAFGIPAKTIIGKTLQELPQDFIGEKDPDLLSWVHRTLEQGVTNEMEVWWNTKMGERIFDNRYVPERDATGNVVTILCVARDLTESKRAEEALRQSEQKFRALAENIPNVVFQCRNDARYSFLYLNNAIEELTGYSKEDFLEKGLSFFDLYHPDDLKAMPTPEENNITDLNRNPFHITYRVRHKSGEWRWVDEWGTGVENSEGKVEFLEGIMIDITKRKRAEEALRESEERYRQLVNLSPDAIAVYRQGRIVFANPAAIQMVSAKEADDLIGRSILDFIYPDFQANVKQRLQEVETTGISIPFVEEKFLGLDGSTADVEVAVVPYTFQGGQYIQIVARNITERKRHEREREAMIAVSTALRQATTSADILNVILDQLLALFKADGAVVVLPNSQTRGLVDEMGRGPVGERMLGLNLPPGSGISNWIIVNQKPYLNNHVDQESIFYRPDLLGESRCVAGVPLIAQDQPIGALWIARRTEITEQDVRLLNAIADIAANAIRRVKLHEQTVQQLHRLIALHQIDLAITTNFDLKVILSVILKNVKDELEVDAASILLLDTVTHRLDYAAGIGFRTHRIEQSHVRLGDGCAGRAAQEYCTVSYPDLQQPPGIFSRSALLVDEEFLSHYATPLIVKGQVKGVLEIFHRKPFESGSEWIDYFETLATQSAIAIESASLFENLQRSNLELMLAYDATIEGWSRALDLRDRETEGHTQRVTEMVLQLAERMGMSDAEKLEIRRGALLHDIGKMGVPDAILLKPGSLSEQEWEVMKQHPTYAYQMLSPIMYLKHAMDIPYCHHEKWDGSGYPRGLKKEEIPLHARLFSLVDVYDALTSDRPYRAAWPRERVREYIQGQAGRAFDPQLVKLFLETI